VRRFLTAAILAALAATPALAEDGAAMRAAADGFYGVYRALPHTGGLPDDAALAKYAPYLAPALEALLRKASSAEDRFAKLNKGAPPLVEGDLFTSLFEGATQVSVGNCTGNGRTGSCVVQLVHADPGQVAVQWTDTVQLVNTPSGWRVGDIAYGGSWDFGNKGTLSATLNEVIAFQ
jgi:hypothetical protein